MLDFMDHPQTKSYLMGGEMSPKNTRCRLAAITVLASFLAVDVAQAGLLDILDGSGGEKTASASDGKCPGGVSDMFRTSPMSATQLIGELRELQGSFLGPNPLQSINDAFLGIAPVMAAASQPQAQSKPQAKGGNKAAKAQPAPPPPVASPQHPDMPRSKDCPEQSSQEASLLGGILGSMIPGGGMFQNAASVGTDMFLDALTSEMSYSAIEAFLVQMLDRPDILSQISVDVPDQSNLSPQLRKQTLFVAAFLAAIKGSNLMVDSASKEFERAKESYKKVMVLQEKAATTLKRAILAKQELKAALAVQNAKGLNAISDQDLQYVQELLDKRPEDFFSDYRVRRVAIAYLRSQPEGQGEIVEMEQAHSEFKSHYGAYSRTAIGAGSMAGFSSQFLKRIKGLWEKQGPVGGIVLVPLVTQGIKEVSVLSVNVKRVFDSSDDMNEGSFLVEKRGEIDKRGISFKRALSRIDDAADLVKADLIREDRSGYVSQLYQHARRNASSLADRLVVKEDRKKVAAAFEMEAPEFFTFQNVLAETYAMPQAKKKRLGEAFLIKASAGVGDGEGAALELVQKRLRDGLEEYTNGDARRLIFARAAATGDQWIVAGDYRIGIDNPGMEGLSDQMDFLSAQAEHATTRAIEPSAAASTKVKKGKK
jgi:hypothetical protein